MPARRLISWFCILVFARGAVAQVPSENLTRQVFLPDGTPAVGAKVSLYDSAERENTSAQFQTVTDKRGAYSVPRWMMRYHYSVTAVNAAGFPIVFSTKIPFQDLSTKTLLPLRLPPPFEYSGRVTAGGKPAVGAQVVVARIHDLPLAQFDSKNPRAQFISHFPELLTRADENGVFRLRGAVVEERGEQQVVVSWAAAFGQGENLWVGDRSWTYGVMPAGSIPQNLVQGVQVETMELGETVPFNVRVLDAVTKAPLANVTVFSSWVYGFDGEVKVINGSSATDADGRVSLRIFKSSEPSGLSLLLTRTVGERKLSYYFQNPPSALATPEITIELPPLVHVRGKIVDETTNVPLLYVQTLQATLHHPELSLQAPIAPVDHSSDINNTPLNSDGTFEAWLPIGTNVLRLTNGNLQSTHVLSGARLSFEADPKQEAILLDVPAAGFQKLVLKAAPRAGQPPALKSFAIARRVLWPDGTPAANLPVAVSAAMISKKPLHLLTDENGVFYFQAPAKILLSPYAANITIDTPGATFYQQALSSYEDLQRIVKKNFTTEIPPVIRLWPEYFVAGKVLTPDGKPVEGARVGWSDYPSSWSSYYWSSFARLSGREYSLRQFEQGHAPTAFTALTKKDGTFVLRGLDYRNFDSYRSNRDATPIPQRIVIAAHDGQQWHALSTRVLLSRRHDAGERIELGDFVLKPLLTLRGCVVDATTQRPIQGATVDVFTINIPAYSNELNGLMKPPTVTTGKDGRFQLEGVPLYDFKNPYELSIWAQKKGVGTSAAWLGVRAGFDPTKSWEGLSRREIILPIQRVVLARGRVLDADTNQPPPVALQLDLWREENEANGFLSVWRENDFRSMEERIGPRTGSTPILSERGEFAVFAPAGFNRASVVNAQNLKGIREAIYEQNAGIVRGADGQITIRVRKKPGVLFLSNAGGGFVFNSDEYYKSPHDYPRLPTDSELLIRNPADDVSELWADGPSILFWTPVKNWGDAVAYRLRRESSPEKAEVWTRIAADPKIPPILLQPAP